MTIRYPDGKTASCAGVSWDDVLERLGDYEHLAAQGRLAILPCKVGDTVFAIHRCGPHGARVVESEVTEMYFANEDMRLCIVLRRLCRGEWGKVIFATREEAERALAQQ